MFDMNICCSFGEITGANSLQGLNARIKLAGLNKEFIKSKDFFVLPLHCEQEIVKEHGGIW